MFSDIIFSALSNCFCYSFSCNLGRNISRVSSQFTGETFTISFTLYTSSVSILYMQTLQHVEAHLFTVTITHQSVMNKFYHQCTILVLVQLGSMLWPFFSFPSKSLTSVCVTIIIYKMVWLFATLVWLFVA